jgi:ribosome biogenesis GTPase
MAADGRVEPVVILTKTDLISSDELDQKISIVSSIAKAKVIALSNITGIGFDEFQKTLSPGRTYCLLGSSGVGKTTLINRLIGREVFDTKAVSVTGEGVHTTSRRQLIVLSQGVMLIDTPGMRELGIIGAGDGVNVSFEEIAVLSSHCRYANCSHENELGCAVRDAVKSGELSEDRYSSYIKLKKESEFYEMSYLDRRKKDKAFGKFIKTAKKQMKD